MADDITYTSASPAGVPDTTKQVTDQEAVTNAHMPVVKLAVSTDGNRSFIAAGTLGLFVQASVFAQMASVFSQVGEGAGSGALRIAPSVPTNPWSWGATTAIVNTTAQALQPATASVRNYVTTLTVTNSHASTGALVRILDGTSGLTLYSGYAAAAGGGFSAEFPTPLRGTVNTAVAAICDATSSVFVSMAGYKAA